MSESHSIASDSLRPHGLYSPWNSPGQNTGVGNLYLLQGIFPTQGSNPDLPHLGEFLASWATRKATPPCLPALKKRGVEYTTPKRRDQTIVPGDARKAFQVLKKLSQTGSGALLSVKGLQALRGKQSSWPWTCTSTPDEQNICRNLDHCCYHPVQTKMPRSTSPHSDKEPEPASSAPLALF